MPSSTATNCARHREDEQRASSLSLQKPPDAKPQTNDAEAHRRGTRRLADDGLQRLQPPGPALGRPARADPRARPRTRLRRARSARSAACGAVAPARSALVSDTNLSYAFDDPAASAVIAGVCAAAEEEGLGLLLVPHDGPAPLSSALDRRHRRVLGRPGRPAARARRRPRAAHRRHRPAHRHRAADRRHRRRGRRDAAARHLTARGHRRFAVVAFGLCPTAAPGRPTSPAAASPYAVSRGRLAGYATALEAGIAWARVPVYECAGSDRAAGRDAAGGYSRPSPPRSWPPATSSRSASSTPRQARRRLRRHSRPPPPD